MLTDLRLGMKSIPSVNDTFILVPQEPTCEVNDRKLIAVVPIEGSLEPLETFSLQFSGVINPSTTKPSGGISMKIYDNQENLLTKS